MIRRITEYDIPSICNIYNYYVRNTTITFEDEDVQSGEMLDRVKEIQKDYTWLVYEKDTTVIGYAYASKWKARSAYRFSAESTVYLDPNFIGKGLGTMLYQALISDIKKENP